MIKACDEFEFSKLFESETMTHNKQLKYIKSSNYSNQVCICRIDNNNYYILLQFALDKYKELIKGKLKRRGKIFFCLFIAINS